MDSVAQHRRVQKEVVPASSVAIVPGGTARYARAVTPVKLADLASSSPTPNAVAGLVAKGALKGVHFQTDDLDAMSERVGDAGAEIVSESAEQFSGSRRPLGGRDLEWARCMQPTATT